MSVCFDSRINKRNMNQDYYNYMEYRVNKEAGVIAIVVADGMGGLSHGEEISKKAGIMWQKGLLEMMLSDQFVGKDLETQIALFQKYQKESMEKINRKMYVYMLDQGFEGGTTLSTAIIFWNVAMISHCGDSPVYFMRDGKIKKISEEHNVAESLVREKKTIRGSKLYFQKKNLLTDYIGKNKKADPFTINFELAQGDKLLIGSDGAFGPLTDTQIQSIFLKKTENADVIQTIMESSRDKGEEDNQTLVLYEHGTKQEKVQKEQENPKKTKKGFFTFIKSKERG